MASLPSYLEATTRPDWLRIAAPYVRPLDYPSLCLVSRRARTIFAPRLWADLLTAVRHFGLHSADDLSWWFDFVFQKLDRVSPETRGLVHLLDARHFGRDAYHFASDQHDGLLEKSFDCAMRLLPNVHSVLLDGHADLNAGLLFGRRPSSASGGHRLRMLSLAGCPHRLPNTFFSSPSLHSLVYLDASNLPGSVLPLLHSAAQLSDLRVLKLRQREIDDSTVGALAESFSFRLWSLDVSDNNMTDAAVDALCSWCIPASSLRSSAHFAVEGRLVSLPHGTEEHGPFILIEESPSSGTFSHPERHFVDAPTYLVDAAGRPDLGQTPRSDGAAPILSDSAKSAARMLSQHEGRPEAEDYLRPRGVTHLHLSRNELSSFGLQKLLRLSSGQLEELDCGSMPLLPRCCRARDVWPAAAQLHGILGAAHLFRPVFSSNLRVLRIHHSLVTHVPTLEADGLSTLARLYLAETSILDRVERAYGQAFVPDMNPRLTCLTLTRIPRRSSGPLTAKLIRFIDLLSVQERAIHAASCSQRWRQPGSLLQGLRRLELEFDPDPMEGGFSTAADAGAQELMDAGMPPLSFFRDERGPATAASPAHARQDSHSRATAVACQGRGSGQDRDKQETMIYDGRWNGQAYAAPVWVGPKVPCPDGVLQRYRRLVLDHGLGGGVGPATPGQILAGAPDGSYVFHTAWCAAVMPPELEPPPADRLAGMKDVLEEVKAHRLAGRARYRELQGLQTGARRAVAARVDDGPHSFWTGTLRVSTTAQPLWTR
ncbi:hypothetical protein CDD83_11045 [Cordyceps sp. RAO-2017]|nr:hypothetical protein CDD83_11045 [Cordyceps sp. RAO-2017]